MEPIYVPCPQPPDWHLIDGFGLDPKDQKWHKPNLPKKLADLAKASRGLTLDQIWEEIELNPIKYAEEVEWIKKMWYFRIYGYWFFNHGVPTYITGKHFYYIANFRIDCGYPKYRYRDRKYWLMIDFIKNHHYDFVTKDKNGRAVPIRHEEDGTPVYKMRDVGRRVFFGDVYPKMRREGATYRAEANNCETITKMRGAMGGIQSRTDTDSKNVFVEKLVRPWKQTWFFFKPIYAGSTSPKTILDFDVPSKSVGGKGASAGVMVGLESAIDFRPGSEGAYDGTKLMFSHDDEVGKSVDIDVWARWLIKKECLSQNFGLDIHGYCSNTSTVGEMIAGGGANFKMMCDMSDYYRRNELGQTDSGLVVFFISSAEGLEDDSYGNYDEAKGLKTIEIQRDSLLRNKNLTGWIEKVRQYPIYYRECFSSTGSDLGFNLYILEQRIQQLKAQPYPSMLLGNFERQNPADMTSPVFFMENPDGRFVISRQILNPNQMYQMDSGHYAPYKAGLFNVGVDLFRFNQTEHKRMSLAGLAVKMRRDLTIDPIDKKIEDWESDRFVCTYLFRPPTKEDACRDVLACAQYYNAMILSEDNVSDVRDNLIKWGFGGFLKHLRDAQGKFRLTPGFNTAGGNKERLFNALRDYIERRGMFENHLEFLDQAKGIQSIEKLKDFDLLTAGALALVSEESDYELYQGFQEEDEEEGITDISQIFRPRSF
jgi:hypothetical protein